MKKTKVVCTMGPNTNDSAERTTSGIEYKHCNSS